MRFKSVSTKLNIAVSAISSISLIIAFLTLFSYLKLIELDTYHNTQKELKSLAKDKIASKMRVGITNAISIANDQRIKTALETNKREFAIASLKDISNKMKKYTDFKNIKIHLHTIDNKSFLRNWKVNKYGDDLSSFRASVVYVNNTLEPIKTFEAGRAGLLLRAITPIINDKGKHVGSLEFIQGINSVVKSFEKTNQCFLLLKQQKVKKSIERVEGFSFYKDLKFKNYFISQKYLNKNFIADAKTINMQKLFKNGYLLSDKYFYTYLKINDFKNEELGLVLLAKPLSTVNQALDGAKTLIYLSIIGIFGMTIIISIVIIIAIRKLVVKPLQEFQNALLNFFAFLQGKQDYTRKININTNDEFGAMAKLLEENIAVSAMLHKKIKEQANRDSLTNMYNRRYFSEISEKMIAITKRQKEPLSVLVIDIDNFKNINDTYGHNVGDEVIKQLANKLMKTVRKSDVVARFGGEEFAIILTNTDAKNAVKFAQTLRRDVENQSYNIQTDTIKFTISIGVDEFKFDEDDGIDNSLNRADKALYQSKSSGKNKITLF